MLQARRGFQLLSRMRLAICAGLISCLFPGTGLIQAHAQTTSPASKEMIVGTKQAPPFAMKTPSGEWEGVGIDLWRRIAGELNLKYHFKEVDLPGMIKGPADGSLDAAVGALTITAEREKSIDFSQPFYETGLSIAVPKDRGGAFAAVKGIFSRNLILGILGLLGVIVTIGTLLWLIERRKNHHYGGGITGLISGMLWSATTAVGHPHHKAPTTVAGELLAILWMLTSVLALSGFTALIASALTANALRSTIHGVNDLHSLRVGSIAGAEAEDYLSRQRIGFRVFPDLNAGLAAVKDGQLDAFVHDRPLLAWQIRQNYSDTLELLQPLFDKQSYGIALPTGSPLREPIDRMILTDIRGDWWRQTTFRYLGESPDHRPESPVESVLSKLGHHRE